MPQRLFYAIPLDEDCRAALEQAVRKLRQCGKGRFVPPQNWHITLHFIGETERGQAAAACLGALSGAPFSLRLAGLGRFARREGDILWAGVEPAPPLLALHEGLEAALAGAGFAREARPYWPHITLARRGVLRPGLAPETLAGLLPPCPMAVDRVCLMRSQRAEGSVVYTVVAERRLEGEKGMEM